MSYKSMMDDPAVLRELIMDHYQYPRNHELTEDKEYASVHMASDSCIDDITVQTKIEGDTIKDIRFDGMACTISTASTSMMSDLLKGKSLEEAKDIIANFYSMCNGREFDPEKLEEAVALKNVYRQANRINCATVGWRAMSQMIEEKEEMNERESKPE